MSTKDRVTKLELLSEGKPKRFQAVFEDGGKRWITSDVDYSQSPSGEQDINISDEEYQRMLADTSIQVILVRYVSPEEMSDEQVR